MAARYYCDGCGKEMPANESGRVERETGNIKVEVMTAVDGVWNGGHVCHACVVAVVRGVPLDLPKDQPTT